MKKKVFRYTLCVIMLFAVIYMCFNSTTRRLISRVIEIHKLQADIEEAKKTNLEYQKRLEYLQTKPREIEKIVKADLGVLAEGEIEYRFNDEYDTKENENENKN